MDSGHIVLIAVFCYLIFVTFIVAFCLIRAKVRRTRIANYEAITVITSEMDIPSPPDIYARALTRYNELR